jgi:hypothetical protein
MEKTNQRYRMMFRSHFKYLRTDATQLPFTAGGGTESGLHEKYFPEMLAFRSIFNTGTCNNQDAMALSINQKSIIGVVCDGAASPEGNLNHVSDNEVGASLVARLTVLAVEKLLSRKNKRDTEAFLTALSRQLYIRLRSVQKAMYANNKENGDGFAANFLTTTICGFFITKERSLVFNCGDGMAVVNGDLKDFSNSEGAYFSNLLFKAPARPETIINQFQYLSGNTNDLKSLVVGSDGYLDLFERFKPQHQNFFADPKDAPSGYNSRLLMGYRKNVLRNETIDGQFMPVDDCTFLLVQRRRKSTVQAQKKTVTLDVSTLNTSSLSETETQNNNDTETI